MEGFADKFSKFVEEHDHMKLMESDKLKWGALMKDAMKKAICTNNGMYNVVKEQFDQRGWPVHVAVVVNLMKNCLMRKDSAMELSKFFDQVPPKRKQGPRGNLSAHAVKGDFLKFMSLPQNKRNRREQED